MERIDFIYEQLEFLSDADVRKLLILVIAELDARRRKHKEVQDAESS